MKVYEIGTGYTSIPAQMGAATEIVVEELAKAMVNNKEKVTIVDMRDPNRQKHSLPMIEVWMPKSLVSADVKLGILHKIKRVVYSIFLCNKLNRLVRREKDTVILHFHNQYNLFFFLKLTSKKIREKTRIVYTNHSHIWHGDWEEIKDTIKKRYFQEIVCLKEADNVFVLNEQTKENIIQHIGVAEEKITVIANGVNVQIYRPMGLDEKRKAKDKLGLLNKKVFIHVGSVCERKNQKEAVQELLPLLKSDRDIVFCYAGGLISPEYQQQIETFAREQGIADQVQYMGELKPGEELNSFYNSAEAMIFPSRAEGFSLVVLEAMATGIPVIIKDTLQFELMDSCLRYRNSQEFIDLIVQQVLNPLNREKIGKAGLEKILMKFSWERVAETYMNNTNRERRD